MHTVEEVKRPAEVSNAEPGCRLQLRPPARCNQFASVRLPRIMGSPIDNPENLRDGTAADVVQVKLPG